jgi:hypothetical protein
MKPELLVQFVLDGLAPEKGTKTEKQIAQHCVPPDKKLRVTPASRPAVVWVS